jgi:putative tryptophan/tyrosine transport system substrate-binding protein
VHRLGIAVVLLVLAQCWQSVRAEEPKQPRRIAMVLVGFTQESSEPRAFLEGLKAAGYAEGKDVILDWYSAQGDIGRIPAMIASVMARKPDVLVVESTLAVREAKRVTSAIPIVIAVSIDPVGSGLIESLAHPGGNITGLSLMATDITSKRLHLLKEAVPGLKSVGCIQDSRVPAHRKMIEDLRSSAKALGLSLSVVDAEKVIDVQKAISKLQRARVQAVYILDKAFVSRDMQRIVEQANKLKLPLTSGYRGWAEQGALLTYSADVGACSAAPLTTSTGFSRALNRAICPWSNP